MNEVQMRPAEFDVRISVWFPKISELAQRQKDAYVQCIWHMGLKHKAHRSDPLATSFSYLSLEKWFGQHGFNKANELVGLIAQSRNWRRGANGDGETRKYNPSPQLAEFYLHFFSEGTEEKHPLLSEHKPLRRIPNAVRAKDLRGNDASISSEELGGLNFSCSVNVQSMKMLSRLLYGWRMRSISLSSLPPKLTDMIREKVIEEGIKRAIDWIELCLRSAWQLLQLSQTATLGHGCVPTLYVEGGTGRFWAQGVSLQSCPKLVRWAATDGFYEYDIGNCHFSIISQRATLLGVATPMIDKYLCEKKEIRTSLAIATGCSEKAVKQALLTVLYGGRVDKSPKIALRDCLGFLGQARFVDHEFVRALERELLGVMRPIINAAPGRGNNLHNVVHKGTPKDAAPRKIFAHLIQGYETQILRAFLPCLTNIVVLQHDGFTCETKQDVEELTETAFAETGIEIQLEEQQVSIWEQGEGYNPLESSANMRQVNNDVGSVKMATFAPIASSRKSR